MANMIEKFKENKKVMMIKMDQASKMADEAAEEFISTLKPLLKVLQRKTLRRFFRLMMSSLRMRTSWLLLQPMQKRMTMLVVLLSSVFVNKFYR